MMFESMNDGMKKFMGIMLIICSQMFRMTPNSEKKISRIEYGILWVIEDATRYVFVSVENSEEFANYTTIKILNSTLLLK